MADKRPITVLVVDDHLVVRQGFGVMLDVFEDLKLVGEAEGGEQALRLCEKLRPDVVLMDMIMPGMDGAMTTRAIRQQFPGIKVIALTSFTDNKQLVQSALEAGAVGYLFKNVSVEDLVHTIRAAHAGAPTITPEVTQMLIEARQERTAGDFNLSDREKEVLRLLATGKSNAEIAQALNLSLSTVKFHVSNVLGKLGANSRSEATYIANEHNLI